MPPSSLSALAQFCVEQREQFSAPAWTHRSEGEGLELAQAAEYLSMTSWYGHEEALAAVAAQIRARLGCGAGSNQVHVVQFRLTEFSSLTRYLLALRRVASANSVQNERPIAGS